MECKKEVGQGKVTVCNCILSCRRAIRCVSAAVSSAAAAGSAAGRLLTDGFRSQVNFFNDASPGIGYWQGIGHELGLGIWGSGIHTRPLMGLIPPGLPAGTVPICCISPPSKQALPTAYYLTLLWYSRDNSGIASVKLPAPQPWRSTDCRRRRCGWGRHRGYRPPDTYRVATIAKHSKASCFLIDVDNEKSNKY